MTVQNSFLIFVLPLSHDSACGQSTEKEGETDIFIASSDITTINCALNAEHPVGREPHES